MYIHMYVIDTGGVCIHINGETWCSVLYNISKSGFVWELGVVWGVYRRGGEGRGVIVTWYYYNIMDSIRTIYYCIVLFPWQQDMWSRMKEAGVPLGVSLHNTMINVHLYNRQPFSPKVSLYYIYVCAPHKWSQCAIYGAAEARCFEMMKIVNWRATTQLLIILTSRML